MKLAHANQRDKKDAVSAFGRKRQHACQKSYRVQHAHGWTAKLPASSNKVETGAQGLAPKAWFCQYIDGVSSFRLQPSLNHAEQAQKYNTEWRHRPFFSRAAMPRRMRVNRDIHTRRAQPRTARASSTNRRQGPPGTAALTAPSSSSRKLTCAAVSPSPLGPFSKDWDTGWSEVVSVVKRVNVKRGKDLGVGPTTSTSKTIEPDVCHHPTGQTRASVPVDNSYPPPFA